MSRAERRQSALALPWAHFDTTGRCYAFTAGPFNLTCVQGRPVLTLAAEVRNGLRWPWLDPRDAVRVLRGRQGLARAYAGNLAKRWRRRGDAGRWLAALELTPRERAELLAYLTRGYL